MTEATDTQFGAALRRAARRDAEAAAARAAGALPQRAAEAGVLEVAYATLHTPVGTGLVAATRRGLVRVALPNEEPEDVVAELAARLSPRVMEWPQRLDEVRRELDEYFSGRRRQFELKLDRRLIHGDFARRVLSATARVPFGLTTTYAAVAADAGRPRAHRAAGNALGSNPIPIVVPCHRVLRTGGGIGNYGGGPAMKEFLLRLEGALGD